MLMAQGGLNSSEIVLDIFCNIRSQVIPGISLERRAIWTNQELLKIPGNVCPLDWLPDQQLRVSHQAILNMKVVSMTQHKSSEPTGSSLGWGNSFFRNVKIGCSFSPFASTYHSFVIISVNNTELSLTLSNSSPLNSNPLPGLTCFKAARISCPLEFSWWPN